MVPMTVHSTRLVNVEVSFMFDTFDIKTIEIVGGRNRRMDERGYIALRTVSETMTL